MQIEFFIPVKVIPKQSGRMVARGGFVRMFTPKLVRKNAEALAAVAGLHAPESPLTGPLRVRYCFQFPYRKSERRAVVENSTTLPKDTRPDTDNLCKQVTDVLQSCGYFKDDSQIWHLEAKKVWTSQPGVQVWVSDE